MFRNRHKDWVCDQMSCRPREITIDNYNLFGFISEGSYCKVRLVQCRKTKQLYALKYMPKSLPSVKRHIMVQERNVLADLHHPLLANLRFAFQDKFHMYMVLDFMAGGDLRYYLKRYTLSEDAIRQTIAEVACAIEYVHEHSLVHRDVKPENILLDANGHAHLCDFNIAAKLTPERPLISGLSGTFNYLAPEMHSKHRYGEQVDWWALGVVLYECFYGVLPFRGKSRREMMYKMDQGPVFPMTDPPVPDDAIHAIKAFLEVVPGERIRNIDDIFRLPFFKGMSRSQVEHDYAEGKPGGVGLISSDVLHKNSLPVTVNSRTALKYELGHWNKKANSAYYVSRGSHDGQGSKFQKLVQRCKHASAVIIDTFTSRRVQTGEDDTMLDSGYSDGYNELYHASEFKTFYNHGGYFASMLYHTNTNEAFLLSHCSRSSSSSGSGGEASSGGTGNNMTTLFGRSEHNRSETLSPSRSSPIPDTAAPATNNKPPSNNGSDGREVPYPGHLPAGVLALGRAGRGARHVLVAQ